MKKYKRYVVAAAILTSTYGITAMDPGISSAPPVIASAARVLPEVPPPPPNDVVEQALASALPKVESNYDPNWTASEKHIRAERSLTSILFGECRGERDAAQCMTLVGHVSMNRARSNLDARYGRGLWGVINKHKQFSCLNKRDPSYKVIQKALKGKLKPTSPDARRWELAKKIAHDLMHVGGEDPTAGSTHYFAHKLVKPRWIHDRGMVLVAQIGGHTFYKKS